MACDESALALADAIRRKRSVQKVIPVRKNQLSTVV
jgi:hypothetical protein